MKVYRLECFYPDASQFDDFRKALPHQGTK
jgi:hypothetical protein